MIKRGMPILNKPRTLTRSPKKGIAMKGTCIYYRRIKKKQGKGKKMTGRPGEKGSVATPIGSILRSRGGQYTYRKGRSGEA